MIISLLVALIPFILLLLKGDRRNQGNVWINGHKSVGASLVEDIAVSHPRAIPDITCVGQVRSKYTVAKSVSRDSTAGE